ncbi:MAG TPA: hypothetical protein VLE47_04235 [Candidatus Saccharimonadales bacterium]|nr:hypothetical protein [Candidatus Saccharimonadales bacterium]
MKFRLAPLIASFLLLFPKNVLAATTVPETGGFAQLSDLVVVFANLTSIIATFAGFAILIMLIRGGIAYITAQGDPKALTAARASLTWAIVGLILILAAYLIISLIVGFVQVPGLGRFCLPTVGSNAATFCQIHSN